MVKTTIVKNDRFGYGYFNETMKCSECGCTTTRYAQISNALLCKGCLWNIIEEMNKSLLETVKWDQI